MGILDIFRRSDAADQTDVRAMAGDAAIFTGFDDPAFYEFLRSGGSALTASGATITVREAMRNTTVLRCVSLIAFSIGMLPLHLQRKADKAKADDHPLFRVLHRKPNAWQTAFEFRSLMQQRALTDGDAFALIVRSGNKVTQLVPLGGDRVQVRQRDDWALEYPVDRGKNGTRVVPQGDMFHLRYGLSADGITGLSLVRQAAEAIGLAQQAERAAARMFRNGMIIGGALKHPGKLSPEAYARLKAGMNEDAGAENAHKWKILEEGMELQPFSQTGQQGQAIEQRKHQIEEAARPFGVPRPLLGVDDTSWGSGIDVLGQFFVRYSLNPWFEAWQQAIERSLLTDAEADFYEAKFNAGALLRGSMKDQAEFFAKGLGSGGHTPWLHPDEPREWMDMPARDDLPPAPGQQTGGLNDPDNYVSV
ncbi:phage portal protein [Roseovarius sp. SCSIO 43702]|nr:phage portal protein [Roseovarius sp. SCSIO 43702]